MGLTILSKLLGSAIFLPGYHASWESVAVFGIVFTSTSNRWNCDRLRRLRERSMRHRRHRAIFSSIFDLNASICPPRRLSVMKDFVGGSYVVVQKYLHDLCAWAKIPTPLQEEIIGRTKIDNIEIDDDDAPRK